MICLADNDIVKKLAICDLLDEALLALDVSYSDVMVLPTARFSLGVAKNVEKTRARLGGSTFDRLKSFLDSVTEIRVDPDRSEQLLLEDVMCIDPVKPY